MIWPLVEQNFNVKERRLRTEVDFDARSGPPFISTRRLPDRRPGAGSGPAPDPHGFLAEFSKYRAEAGARRQASRKRRFNVWKSNIPSVI